MKISLFGRKLNEQPGGVDNIYGNKGKNAAGRAEADYFGDDESATYGDFIADDRTESQADAADRNLLKERIAEVLKGLTERERIVMESRYGLKDGVQRTLDEVGLLFNVTRERIRQIEMSALEKLREGKCVAMLAEFFSP